MKKQKTSPYNTESLDNFKTLPIEITKYMFSFFNAKTLLHTQAVNKTFKELSKETIAKTAKQIFYTVGLPVLVTGSRLISNSDMGFVERKNIPDKELLDSWLNITAESIHLFEEKKDAIVYSNRLQFIKKEFDAAAQAKNPVKSVPKNLIPDSDDDALQATVIKVQYLGPNPNSLPKAALDALTTTTSLTTSNLNPKTHFDTSIAKKERLLPIDAEITINSNEGNLYADKTIKAIKFDASLSPDASLSLSEKVSNFYNAM